MNRFKSLLALRAAVALTAALPLLPAPAAEPSSSAMFRGGPQLTGVYPGPAPRGLAGVRFVVRTGGPIRSSPAVADGTLYVGSTDGIFHALDAGTGEARWSFAADSPISASPAVSNGLVYFTSRAGTLYALSAANGRQRWRVSMGPATGAQDYWDFYTSSPSLFGGRLYVGSGSGRVYAIDAASGHVAWSVDVGSRIRSTPAVTDRAVVFGTMSGHVIALDRATGAQLWRFATEGASHNFETRHNDTTAVFASPTIANGIVAVGGRDGQLYALDLATGAQRWRITHDGSSWILSTGAADGTLYVGSGSAYIAQAVELATGTERWRFPTGTAIFGSPAIAGDVLLFDDLNGVLHALNRANGREYWHFALGDSSFSSPVAANGIVYAGADNGLLYALDTTTVARAEAPAPRRLVYFENAPEGPGFRFFPAEVAQAIAAQFRGAGYEQIGADQLLAAIADQIAHPDHRTRIVFADNLIPSAAMTPSTDQAPLRRFLEAGGTIVFLGDDPALFVRDPNTGQIAGTDTDGPLHILDLHYPPFNRDRGYHISEVTADGRRLGLTGTFVSSSPIGADQAGLILAHDEFGFATEWVRTYGTSGGRLIQLAIPRRAVSDLHPAIQAIALAADRARPD